MRYLLTYNLKITYKGQESQLEQIFDQMSFPFRNMTVSRVSVQEAFDLLNDKNESLYSYQWIVETTMSKDEFGVELRAWLDEYNNGLDVDSRIAFSEYKLSPL